jgi:hypothetical protein
MSNYRWNGVDPQVTYGLFFKQGVDAELMKLPKLKDNGLSISWADEDGTERYHGVRKFESRSLSIGCVMIANSESQLMSRYNSLTTFLLTNGEFNFDVISRNRRYKVSYQDMTSVNKITNFIGHSKVAIQFTIILIDDYPTSTFTIST